MNGRSSARIFQVAALACVGATVASPACTVNEPTEFVPGVSTQVQVPKDLAGITIDISSGGVSSLCQQYDVVDGYATLPGTLGVVPGGANSSLPVTITVRGYTAAAVQSQTSTYMTCTATDPSSDANDYSVNPRVLRRSIVSFVDKQELFLPFPLKFACFDQTGCDSAQCDGGACTCKGGACVPATVDPTTLAVFTPGMGDGTSANCFDPTECFYDGQPAVPFDLGKCEFTFFSAPLFPGLNVRAYYGGNGENEAEYLDLDPEEGFTVDKDNPTRFTLAPGLCQSVQNYIARAGALSTGDAGASTDAGANEAGSPTDGGSMKLIYAMDVASKCAPKTATQPICASAAAAIMNDDGGALPVTKIPCEFNQVTLLNPAPSALLVLLYRTPSMSPLFGASAFEQVLQFSLSAPAFATTDVALKLVPTIQNVCGGAELADGFSGPDVNWELAEKSQFDIASAVSSWSNATAGLPTPPPPVGLDNLLSQDGIYQDFNVFVDAGTLLNQQAVLVMTNTDVTDDCPTDDAGNAPVAAAGAAAAADAGIQTYVIILGDPFVDGGSFASYPGADNVASGGNTGQSISAVTGSAAAIGFNQVVANLSTCLYSQPSTPIEPGDGGGTTFEFTLVSDAGISYAEVPFDSTCSPATQGTSNGWNVDAVNDQIRVCGQWCTNMQNAYAAGLDYALAANLPTAPLMPVAIQQSIQCQ